MAMRTVEPEELDILAHQAEYAKASGAADNPDHVANLQTVLAGLIQKRRNLAQDAVFYPIANLGRGMDIARIQPIIEAVERAIEDEKRRAGN